MNNQEKQDDIDRIVKLANKIAKPWQFCTIILAILLIFGTYKHFDLIKSQKAAKITIERANNDTTTNSNIIK